MNFNYDIFDGDPLEHLVKILQNASPQAIQNTFEGFLNDYAILEIAVEEGISKDSDIKYEYKERINTTKQDLAIRLMSEILSQE